MLETVWMLFGRRDGQRVTPPCWQPLAGRAPDQRQVLVRQKA